MGCVLGREASSGVVDKSKEERRGSENYEKKNKSLNDESNDSVEVTSTIKVDNGNNVAEVEEGGGPKEEKVTEAGEKPRSERRRSKPNPRLGNLPKHKHGEQVAAGWPSWLSAHVGEAIDGWLPRRADTFEKIDKIGSGTYSNVYKARDTITGKIVALKKVRFDNLEPESVRFMAREIIILRRLDHPNVIKLEGLVTSRMSCSLYLVFEYMEHDLAGLAASPDIKFTEAQVKCYMKQLLSGLEHCHKRHVLHRDIKGSNLLLDNSGILRIADFGLATIFDPNHKHPMTSRVVTLWYRPPELLLGATDYSVGIDLWSAGCILAELLAGKPIMPGRTEVEQLHKIFKLCGSPSEAYWKRSKLPHATIFKPQQPYKRTVGETFKDFPASTLALLNILLAFEPQSRGSTTSALQHEFFTKKPLPCDPSMLPKYPPSKEFDVKVRDEAARRQKAANGKGRGSESHGKSFKESRAVPAPDANAELPASIQKYKGLANSKSSSEQFNHEEESGSGFPIDPAGKPLFKGLLAENGASKSSINMHANEAETHSISQEYSSGHNGVALRAQRSYKPQGWAAQLSRFSNSVAAHGSSHLDQSRNESTHSQWRMEQLNSKYNASHSLLGLSSSLYNKDEAATRQEHNAAVSSPKQTKMHYSGPLFPAAGNLDEMLKEHERHIQQAVRKARFDKNKNKKGYRDNAQTESLLQYVGNGR